MTDDTTRRTMPSSVAAEYIGVALSSLQRARRTGTLLGLKAPESHMIRVGSVLRVMYTVADLDRWHASHVSRPRKLRKQAAKNAGDDFIASPAPGMGGVMTFSAAEKSRVPLLVHVRHRTYLRALNLHHTICARWRYDTTQDGHIILRAVVSLPDGDAGYCHMADDTPKALSIAAEDLVVTLWKAAKDNPEAVSAIATAARASIGPPPSSGTF